MFTVISILIALVFAMAIFSSGVDGMPKEIRDLFGGGGKQVESAQAEPKEYKSPASSLVMVEKGGWKVIRSEGRVFLVKDSDRPLTYKGEVFNYPAISVSCFKGRPLLGLYSVIEPNLKLEVESPSTALEFKGNGVNWAATLEEDSDGGGGLKISRQKVLRFKPYLSGASEGPSFDMSSLTEVYLKHKPRVCSSL